MPVDLTTSSLLSKAAVVIADDALVLLEIGLSGDRVRRLHYDQIAAVTFWQKPRVVGMTICLLLTSLGLFISRIFENIAPLGYVLAGVGAVFLLLFYLRPKMTIRVAWAGQLRELTGATTRRNYRAVVAKLRAAIEARQMYLAQRAGQMREVAPDRSGNSSGQEASGSNETEGLVAGTGTGPVATVNSNDPPSEDS